MAVSARPRAVRGSGVTAPLGFSAGVGCADIRGDGSGRPDLALVVSELPAAAAGVFTSNRVKAAPVVVSQLHLKRGLARALVANSGNANACTGSRGLADALRMVQRAAEVVDCAPGEVLVASTGVIGRPLPIERVEAAIEGAGAQLQPGGGHPAAEAIMTTDTHPKEAEAHFELEGRSYQVGGMAKGSGMIHPDMATLLAFVATDASASPELLGELLREGVRGSFNTISVDGDTSTNDCCLALANGARGGPQLEPGSRGAGLLGEALARVLEELAEQVVGDGEGATRTFSVLVTGAASDGEAMLAARTVTASPLVKAAVHGGDPNWGRVLAAVGRSGAALALDRCRLTIAGQLLFANGQAVEAELERLAQALLQPRVEIEMDLGVGEARALARGCDLSAEYVRVNADYST